LKGFLGWYLMVVVEGGILGFGYWSVRMNGLFPAFRLTDWYRRPSLFHYEFEHDPSHPDEVCAAAGSPSGAVVGERNRAAQTIRGVARQAADESHQEDTSLASCLDALGAWLANSDRYDLNEHRVPPPNARATINDAVAAATIHE
jgi:hypothetical protein